MIKGPYRLQYAIIKIVASSPYGYRQYSWGRWGYEVGQLVPDYTPRDLLVAFKALWKSGQGVLRLSKPDLVRRDACYYSGVQADDDAFFFNGDFNAAFGQNYPG